MAGSVASPLNERGRVYASEARKMIDGRDAAPPNFGDIGLAK